MKNHVMVQQYWSDKPKFLARVTDAINGLDCNKYIGYRFLDEETVEAKLDSLLSNMKTLIPVRRTDIGPTLARSLPYSCSFRFDC